MFVVGGLAAVEYQDVPWQLGDLVLSGVARLRSILSSLRPENGGKALSVG